MTKNETNKLINILKKTYPDAKCSLDFSTPFELVVAVMLSAQCTDERVNLTTPSLFKRCKTIEDFANIDIKELEEIIHPCGFCRNKAKNIKLCAKQVIENFSGEVPQDMDSLLTLAGVGRKSANIDKKYLKDVNHLFIWHGRYTCTARNPKCEDCTIKVFCKKFKERI